MDINCTDKDNHTGLFKVRRNKEIAEFFIQHPDLDIEEVNREKILGDINLSDEDLVRKLCDLPGIDVNAGNPLRRAAFTNKIAVIKILARNPELDWNNGGSAGGYPITAALDGGRPEIVEYLLEQTLDLNVLNYGKSVGHLAVEYSWIKKRCPEQKNVTRFPVKCVELLSKDQRMDWNIRDDNGDTPIMIAMKNKEMEMVKILLKTPGVDLGDITNTKAGIDLMKEMGADQMRADLLSKVPE